MTSTRTPLNLLAPVCFAIAAMLFAPDSAAAQSERAIRLQPEAVSRVVADYARRNSVPGLIVVVTDGPEVIFAGGFGRDSAGRAITSETVLPIASLSKSFTALAVMQLVESGKLGLDDPVINHVPEFELADPAYRDITVRQLLEHRSGMSDTTFREKNVVPVPTSLESAVRALRSANLASAPGTRRSYHNPNYWVAARLVEALGGLPFGEYLRERVFLPLGMSRTAAIQRLGEAPDIASGHIRILGVPIALQEPAWFLGGCCGVVTTATDLAKWLSFHAQAEQGAAVPGMISPQHARMLHDGLGSNLSAPDAGPREATHNGILFTFTAKQEIVPGLGRGFGLAVVTNTGVGFAPLDAESVALLIRSLVAKGNADQPLPTGLIVDIFLAVAVVLLVGLAVRGRRPAHDRVRSRHPFVTIGRILMIAWFAAYPWSLRAVTRRDLNWEQAFYISPLAMILVAWLAARAAWLLIPRRR